MLKTKLQHSMLTNTQYHNKTLKLDNTITEINDKYNELIQNYENLQAEFNLAKMLHQNE